MVTDSSILSAVALKLNKQFGDPSTHWYYVEERKGRYVLMQKDTHAIIGKGVPLEVSPHLSKVGLYHWVHALMDGLHLGYERGYKDGVNTVLSAPEATSQA